jgi:hypothetical protein
MSPLGIEDHCGDQHAADNDERNEGEGGTAGHCSPRLTWLPAAKDVKPPTTKVENGSIDAIR